MVRIYALCAIETDNNTRERRLLMSFCLDLAGNYLSIILERLLFWRLAKVIAEQHPHRDRNAVAHGGEEMHLSHGIDD